MDELITVTEASARFGLHRDTIWRWHREGLLPLTKRVGIRATLVKAEDVERVKGAHRPAGRPRHEQA